MKTFLYKSAFLALVLLAVTVVSGCNNEATTFQVNDVVSDPGAYSGPMIIEGVVYAYAQTDNSIVGVMDKKELQCTTPNCNKVLLPVKVGADRPRIGDEVKISGAISKEEWGYLLQAEKIEVLANHKLGGV